MDELEDDGITADAPFGEFSGSNKYTYRLHLTEQGVSVESITVL